MRDPQPPPTRAAGLWDDEWTRSWKPHPGNIWFDYEAGIYNDKLGGRAPRRPARGLKTDAFDEACGRWRLAPALADAVVLVDVSPLIAEHAARPRRAGVVVCTGDVRCLPFPDATFDVVLSTSTLDHFDQRADLGAALAELRRVLRAGGRLLVTLDNPANPILRLRGLLGRLTGPLGGLLPFRPGRTLTRRGLVAAVERAGFAVHESGYLVHAPRLPALWASEWAARWGWSGAARRFAVVLAAIERVARRLPTRRWTAHFVFADCRPRGLPAGSDSAPP